MLGVVLLPQGRVVQVQVVQVRAEAVERVVLGELAHEPVLLAALVPLAQLRHLGPHEVQLLAGVHHHVAVQRACLRKLEVALAPHLLGDGGLAVHHLVVAERQQVALVPKVHHAEAELVVVAATEVRVKLEVAQRVVHPAHVPLVVKAQAALLHGAGGALVVRRVLRDGERARVERLHAGVQALHELDVLVVHAAGLVALPVDDAADGVHAHRVEVVAAQPEVHGALHEAARLPAAVHEVVTAPLAHAHGLVGVLEERRAVVVGEAPRVRGKVHGHHVQDAADAGLVQRVHQVHELLRRAVAAGGAEEARRLVAPRPVERVLAQRHELHVVVAGLREVVHQRLRQLLVGVPVRRVVGRLVAGALAPRAHVHLVHVQGPVQLSVAPRASLHPRGVAPLVGEVPHDGAVAGPQLRRKRVRVRVVHVAAAVVDAVLVVVARLGTGNLRLPEVAVLRTVHLVRAVVQEHHDAVGCGRERPEDDAALRGMRAQVVLRIELGAAIEVLDVHALPSLRVGLSCRENASLTRGTCLPGPGR